MKHIVFRMVATYFPHAGYSVDDYNMCFDAVRKTVIDGQQINHKCFVGGDFNTILNFGWRGNRLREFVHETNLEVSNDPSKLNVLEEWTFRGTLGHKRIIDYCLVPGEYVVQSSRSINGLDLGSDHRAVQCCTLLPPNGTVRKEKGQKGTYGLG